MKRITWSDIKADVDAVAAMVSPLCSTDTTGIEDWLSAASTGYSGTAEDLAREWDNLNS